MSSGKKAALRKIIQEQKRPYLVHDGCLNELMAELRRITPESLQTEFNYVFASADRLIAEKRYAEAATYIGRIANRVGFNPARNRGLRSGGGAAAMEKEFFQKLEGCFKK